MLGSVTAMLIPGLYLKNIAKVSKIKEVGKVTANTSKVKLPLLSELFPYRQATTGEGFKILQRIAPEESPHVNRSEGARDEDLDRVEGPGEVASTLNSGKGIYTQYSGGLKKSNKEDAGADLLGEKLDGQSRMIFNNDPKGREFDVVSDKYIGQTKTSMNNLSPQFREQAKATIEAGIETGRKAYFHFETAPADKIIRQLREYEKRYEVEIIIDISPF
ncbi:restriction endonuclease fold toxin [Paenibacillus sp. Marseille-Q4541]|uniref:restriction endonuclease fold toxin n=1 Tax=Paenibacillus sp. Marseille-Q4541 TaxID=2831522 RepID=UPI001BA550E0|nr:restriction endonuclease fold toxin [Paenibacillus sp. Marseille-Q4541]